MTVTVLGFQIILPLALLAWLAFRPAGRLAFFALQAVGIGSFLFALARVAQWAVPVWWAPWLYGALWLACILLRLVGVRRYRSGLEAWLGAGLSVVLMGVGGWFGLQALEGRRLPSVEVVDIVNPFGPGHFLVASGGSNMLINAHMKTLDPGVERYQAWRGQSYAVDFFGLGPWGLRASGWRPADPAAYAIFGTELRAPCAGEVIAAEGGMPDFEVPLHDEVNRLGNHVILRCNDVEIVLAHMRQGSLNVTRGAPVETGQRLGEVGNSGASFEPHLHIHAQRPASTGAPPISGDPLALRIDGRYLVRGDRMTGADG